MVTKKYRNATILNGLLDDEKGIQATLNIEFPAQSIMQIGFTALAVVVLGRIMVIAIDKFLK